MNHAADPTSAPEENKPNMTSADMPRLLPLPIPTKGKSLFKRIKGWMADVRKWMVLEDWEYKLPDGRIVIVPRGFVFDGASIPRPLWGVLSPIGLLLVPGLIHDFAYRYDYIWVLRDDGYAYKEDQFRGRKYWDEMFKEVGEQVNGMEILNGLAWGALVAFGGFAWRANQKERSPDLIPQKAKRFTVERDPGDAQIAPTEHDPIKDRDEQKTETEV